MRTVLLTQLTFFELMTLFLLGLSGCTARSGQKYPDNIQVTTQLEQAEEEIWSTPLVFSVSYEEESEAWERALAYFGLYVNQSGDGSRLSVTPSEIVNSAGASNYAYRVRRQIGRGQYQYSVECSPVGNQGVAEDAQRNARNLARFIRSGVLERELISY